MPSREVYLHSVINLYLRGVLNLYFVRNKLCNFLAFILRLCTNIFCEVPPPLLRGRGYKRLFVHSSSPASCVFLCFAKHHPPFVRLAGMMTVKRVLAPPASCFKYARLAFGFACKDFHRVLRLFCRGGRAMPSAVARQDFPP